MYAVTYLHLFPWDGFSSVHVYDPQRSDSRFAAARDPRGGHRQSRQPTR
ncbi:hypothetical protein SAMN04490194_1589 [Pseudomonas migulae]|uniref:Uncharacterized protein n=1 Tax=Pseudomonas migulae TaxID=78543 RepID=A0A1H5HG22_9PSED|nr:hypothetical protein FBY04_105209 [Pseudomonas sp. SJZ080]SEE26694.1 hypothetical protein SAMN04490194_1589 [Pseudomonas migulae]